MSYSLITLSSDEIIEGKLFQISNALNAAFDSSAKAILNDGKRGDKEDLIVYFDNSSINSSFYDEQDENVQDLLYFNNAAKLVVELAGVKLTVSGTVEEIPEHVGIMNRTCHYINLH